MSWLDCTGRGVRVAIVDSGIHAEHPHVSGIVGGITIGDGDPGPDTTDRIGHGTAVAAAVREKAPDIELYAVRVFERRLSTSVDRLVRGIRWAADAGVHIVNLSLGTDRPHHEAPLGAAVTYAAERGTIIVAAEESEGIRWLPGSLVGVIPVRLDWTCPRESFRVMESRGRVRILASGFARPIPGVPVEANLKGISFAVASVTGFVARACQAEFTGHAVELDAVVKRFTQSGCAAPSRFPGTACPLVAVGPQVNRRVNVF